MAITPWVLPFSPHNLRGNLEKFPPVNATAAECSTLIPTFNVPLCHPAGHSEHSSEWKALVFCTHSADRLPPSAKFYCRWSWCCSEGLSPCFTALIKPTSMRQSLYSDVVSSYLYYMYTQLSSYVVSEKAACITKLHLKSCDRFHWLILEITGM